MNASHSSSGQPSPPELLHHEAMVGQHLTGPLNYRLDALFGPVGDAGQVRMHPPRLLQLAALDPGGFPYGGQDRTPV